jgi:hypothetical protein
MLAPGAAAMVQYIGNTMKLITAHKILIASATVFFVFFAWWELRRFLAGVDSWAMARSILYLLVALGFGVYFLNLKRWYK